MQSPQILDLATLCEQINQPPTLAHLLPWRIIWQPTSPNAPRPTEHHDALFAAIHAITKAVDAADEPQACRQDTRFRFDDTILTIEVLPAGSPALTAHGDHR